MNNEVRIHSPGRPGLAVMGKTRDAIYMEAGDALGS
jgi:hypothetical protein